MTTESGRRTTGAWLFVGRVAAVVESRTLATLISNNNADKVIQVWNLSQKLLNYTHALIKQYTLFEARLQLSRQEAQLSPSDRAMRLVSSNLANYHATVQKLLIRQVLTKPMV